MPVVRESGRCFTCRIEIPGNQIKRCGRCKGPQYCVSLTSLSVITIIYFALAQCSVERRDVVLSFSIHDLTVSFHGLDLRANNVNWPIGLLTKDLVNPRRSGTTNIALVKTDPSMKADWSSSPGRLRLKAPAGAPAFSKRRTI